MIRMFITLTSFMCVEQGPPSKKPKHCDDDQDVTLNIVNPALDDVDKVLTCVVYYYSKWLYNHYNAITACYNNYVM